MGTGKRAAARRRGGGAGVTVIYVDTLFLLNTMVDYLLLLASARLAGEPLARLRFALGAVLGGLYAVAIFLPGMGFLARPLCRGAAAVLMVLLAFWRSRRLLRQVLIFLALACAFGGGVLAVELLGGQRLALGGGVLYSGMDLKIVLLSAAGCYGLLTLVFRGIGRHGGPSGELTRVRLTLGERQVELTGLVDTGNTLTDPATGRPVLVAEADSLEELLPPGLRPGPAELRDPAGALERLEGAQAGLSAGVTPDALLTDVEEALSALGELTGASVREDITDRIFQRFCVGK